MADMEGQLSERRRLRDAVAEAGENKLKARKVRACVGGGDGVLVFLLVLVLVVFLILTFACHRM